MFSKSSITLASSYSYSSSTTTKVVPSPSSVRSMLMKYNNNNNPSSLFFERSKKGLASSPAEYRLHQKYRLMKEQQQHQHRQMATNNNDDERPAWAEYSYDPDYSARRFFRNELSDKTTKRLGRQPYFDRRPFLGSTIEDYTKKYWCVKFTFVGLGHENREMQRYCSWYAVKCKVVYLDYLPFVGPKLREEIKNRMKGSNELPALFVNGKCVGGLSTMRALEESGRLKDVLQFGFMWHSRPDAGPEISPQGLPVPASFYGDDAMYRGQWRGGAPLTSPVVELPKYLPRDSITYGRAMGDKKGKSSK